MAGRIRGLPTTKLCRFPLSERTQEDPHIFEQSLYAYPMCRSKRTVDSFMAEMKELNADDLPPWMK